MSRIKKRAYINGECIWVTGATEKEVQSKIAKLLNTASRHTMIPQETEKAPTPFFESYTESWWRLYKVPKLKPTTATTYRGIIDNHILPFFSGRRLSEIVTSDIQSFASTKYNLSKSTFRQILIILRQIFDSALEDRLIDYNPAASKRIAQPTRVKERKAVAKSDVADIISNLHKLSDQDSLYMHLIIYTGMRRGEIVGLRWEDIDWNLGIISVNRAVTFRKTEQNKGKDRAMISTPKSKAAYRQIPICDQLMAVLTARRQESGYIVNHNGKLVDDVYLKTQWRRIGKTIDLHGATPHCFRHSFATMAVANGIDIKTVQTILGHSNVTTTLKIYAEAIQENIVDAGTKVKSFWADV